MSAAAPRVRLEHGDMLEAIPRLVAEGVVCDACVTDPPYHLVQMSKRAKYPVKHGAMARLIGGFMNAEWDGGDIAFRPETWATVATILRPGAFLLGFGGTRTYHRTVCAIEDAGFVIQDCMMWMFGTGWPKRRDMLKPAYEPLVLAYKPGGKRTLQVDECRVGTELVVTKCPEALRGDKVYGKFAGGEDRPHSGRWPANIAHDGSDEVVACFPESAGGGDVHHRSSPKTQGIYGAFSGDDDRWAGYGDSGSAARFFFSSKAGAQDRWGSKHPTVKPVKLIKWLVKLVTPPGGLVLDCFAGSGTTGVAALGTGRNAILIEREDEYAADIRQRMAFYEGGGTHSVRAKHRSRKVDHGPLFESGAT